MKQQYRSEKAARIALATWLRSSVTAPSAFISALPSGLRSRFINIGPFSVEEEHSTDVGKRIDILLVSGRVAICIEIKIDHRENAFQYIMYRRYLERRGFAVTVVGIMLRRLRSRGREALNTAILEQLADYRVTWAEFVKTIKEDSHGKTFIKSLRDIDPSLLDDLKEPRVMSVALPDLSKIDREPSHLAAFFAQIISVLPDGMSAYPDQAGSSPPLLRFGRDSWADWFGDADKERIFLEVDIPRKSKPLNEMQLHFGVVLWSKTSSGQRRANNIKNILTASRLLETQLFTFQRNKTSKYTPVDWRPSYGLDPAGLYYLNASGCRNFRMLKSEAIQLGTSRVIQLLATEIARLTAVLDELVTSSSA